MRKTSINKVKHEYNTYKYYTRVSLYLQFVNISYEYYGCLVGGTNVVK
jgi:hypothetical protein